MTALKKIGGEKRKLVILAVAVAVGAALTWYVKNYVSLEALVAQEEKVREAIDRRPWRSFALGLVIYSVVSLVPGTSGKSVVFAWMFGFWQGLALIILGLTTAAARGPAAHAPFRARTPSSLHRTPRTPARPRGHHHTRGGLLQ